LPTSIIERNTKFQLEVHENKDAIISHRAQDPLKNFFPATWGHAVSTAAELEGSIFNQPVLSESPKFTLL
jgi:hypothetical protein